MTEHLVADCAHVLRNNISAAFDERICLGGGCKGDAGARRRSEADKSLEILKTVRLRGAGCVNDIHNISFYLLVHIDFTDNLPCADYVLRLYDRLRLREFPAVRHPDYTAFFLKLRIIHNHLEHKTVNLRLWKRIGSFLLDRILGSHNQERLRKRESLVTYCDVTLLHRLKKCGLDFCRSTVDFIRKHEIGEDRALVNLELLALLGVDKSPGDICRQEVRSELNPAEPCIDSLRQCTDSQCLGKARNSFQEDVSIGQEADEEVLNKMLLAYYDLTHLHCKNVHERAFSLYAFVEFFNILTFHIICNFASVMRYLLNLSYDGSAFCGWQIQPDAPSVQQTLQNAIGTLLRETVSVTGAGRTDTGVSATGYIAHFDTDKELDCAQFCYKLNAILPVSIAIKEVKKTADDFHARFDAKRREYTYFLHLSKDPFADRFSLLCTYPLDFDSMNRAAFFLLGEHDFSCFEKSGGDNKTSVCNIFEAGWYQTDPGHWYFRIAADRFLRNMVRAIVGTLIEVGRGRRSAESIAELIESGTRCDAGESVPGKALFLTEINY